MGSFPSRSWAIFSMKHLSFISWVALFLTLCALFAEGLFAWNIQNDEGNRAAALLSAEQSSAVQDSSVRMHAIAQDSAPERAALSGLLGSDVVVIVTQLEGVGKTAGVTLKLSGALPETPPAGLSGGSSIQAVGFAIEADGTFAALMRAIQLFETFPVPSSVERLDMQHATTGGGSWHLSLYIKVLMDASSSS